MSRDQIAAVTTPEIVLYGPDAQNGAIPKKGYTSYIYYLVWYENGNKRERTTKARFPDRAAAEQAFTTFLEQRHADRAAAAPPGGYRAHEITVGQILEFYARNRAESVEAFDSIKNAIKGLWPFWHDRLLSEVGGPTCDEFTKWRTKQPTHQSKVALAAWERRRDAARARRRPFDTPKPPVKLAKTATARNELATLRAAIGVCREELYTRDEAPVKLPPAGEAREEWLTRTDVAKMLLAARAPTPSAPESRHHLIVFLKVALYHGVRKSALLELPLVQPFDGSGWLDAERGVIDFGPPRGKKKRPRHARIHPRVLVYVRAAKRRQQSYLIEQTVQRLGEDEDGKKVPVFVQQPVKDVRRSFASCVRRAGLGDREITPHILRHTAVSWLMQVGLAPARIGDFVAMSAQMVDSVYGHLDPNHQSDVIAATTSRRR